MFLATVGSGFLERGLDLTRYWDKLVRTGDGMIAVGGLSDPDSFPTGSVPLLVIIGAVLLVSILKKRNVLTVFALGKILSAAAFFAFVIPWHTIFDNLTVGYWAAAILFCLIASLGRALWWPRLL